MVSHTEITKENFCKLEKKSCALMFKHLQTSSSRCIFLEVWFLGWGGVVLATERGRGMLFFFYSLG